MGQWGNTDEAANSVIWGAAQYKKESNTANQTNFFGNVSASAFINNIVVGQFGVDTTEIAVAAGNLAFTFITSSGSGYGANAVVTLTLANGSTNATAVNAFANSTTSAGKITLKIAQPGADYVVNPSAAIAAPNSITIAANTTGVPLPAVNTVTANSTGFSNTTNILVIATANTKFSVGDRVVYKVPVGNTAIAPLVSNTYYFVSFANSTTLALAETFGGANIDIVDTRTTNPGESHTIQGDGRILAVTTANSRWQANDRFSYQVPATNTAIVGLISNSFFFVVSANTTGIIISAEQGGTPITFGAAQVTTGTGENHTIVGDTAAGGVTVSGGKNKGIAHAGWVVRTEGTGGRAGRVHYETLVAMSSISNDASDDTALPE